jgi:tRNA-binding EMAP/Myf-like protein
LTHTTALFSIDLCINNKPKIDWLCRCFQISDRKALAALAEEAVGDPKFATDLADWLSVSSSASPDARRAAKLEKFFVGCAMKASKGRAKPLALTAAVASALQARKPLHQGAAAPPPAVGRSDAPQGGSVFLWPSQAADAKPPSDSNSAVAPQAPKESGNSDDDSDDSSSSTAAVALPEIHVGLLDFRVGRITKAWEHPDSDKLWCEEIDVGEATGPRQILSGLRAYYPTPEDMVLSSPSIHFNSFSSLFFRRSALNFFHGHPI